MKTRFFAATMLLLMMGAVTASAQTKTIDRGSQEAEKQARSGQTAAAGKTASQAVQSGRDSGGSTSSSSSENPQTLVMSSVSPKNAPCAGASQKKILRRRGFMAFFASKSL